MDVGEPVSETKLRREIDGVYNAVMHSKAQ